MTEKIFKSESFLKSLDTPYCPIKEIRISDDKIVFVLKQKENS